MSSEGNNPHLGGKPSDPPRGPLGPGITPPRPSGTPGPSTPGGQGGPDEGAGGGPSIPQGPGQGTQPPGENKRFCSNCGKEWPADTTLCTACGTPMGETEVKKKSMREHIDAQIKERQEALVPSFVNEGPPKIEKKGMSSFLKGVLVLLVLIIVAGGVGYFFFKGPIYVYIGGFMEGRDNIQQAAKWYNAALDYYKDKEDGNKAAESLETLALVIYGDYMDAMSLCKYYAEFKMESASAPNKANLRGVIFKSGRFIRKEVYLKIGSGRESIIHLSIQTKDKLFFRRFYPRQTPKTTQLTNEAIQSLKKADKEKTLEGLGEYASWTVEENTEEVGGEECLVLNALIGSNDMAKFIDSIGIVKNAIGLVAAKASSIRFFIGIEDNHLHRLTVIDKSDEKMVSIDFTKIDIDADIPSSKFDLPRG